MSAYPNEYSRMLEVSNDFGYDLLKTERDLFEIDHCAAGAFGSRLGVSRRTCGGDRRSPRQHSTGETGLDTLVQVSWRLADVLGFAAFSPERDWSYEELVAYLPAKANSWIMKGPEEARKELRAAGRSPVVERSSQPPAISERDRSDAHLSAPVATIVVVAVIARCDPISAWVRSGAPSRGRRGAYATTGGGGADIGADANSEVHSRARESCAAHQKHQSKKFGFHFHHLPPV